MKNILFLVFTLFCIDVMACSCSGINPKEIAEGKRNFSKIQIIKPSLIQLLSNKFNKFINGNSLESFEIKVIENETGILAEKNINIDTEYGGGACGLSLAGDEKIYFLQWKNNKTLMGTACNLISKTEGENISDNVKEIKEELRKISGLKKGDYRKINTFDQHENYASIKYKKIKGLVDIWIYSNYLGTSYDPEGVQGYKSFKSEIQISCLNKASRSKSIYYFSDFDSGGVIIEFMNYDKEDMSYWRQANKGHALEKLINYVCR